MFVVINFGFICVLKSKCHLIWSNKILGHMHGTSVVIFKRNKVITLTMEVITFISAAADREGGHAWR